MQWYDTILQTLSMRSFSSIWYWFALAATWSVTVHRVLGVPFDVIVRARRGEDEGELFALTRINVARMMRTARQSGVATVAVLAFALSVLVALSVAGLEMAQAMLCLFAPLLLVGALSLRLAARLESAGTDAETLARKLLWHRLIVQTIAMVSIFVTAIWGMLNNLNVMVLH